MEGFEGVKKTNDASVFLKSISKNSNLKRYTFVLSDKNKGLQKFTTNLKNAETVLYKDLNAHDVFFGGLLVLDNDIFAATKKVTEKEINEKPKKTVERKISKK